MKITCKKCHTRFEEKDKYCPYCYEKASRSIPIGSTNSLTKARTYSRSDLKQFDKTKINRKVKIHKKSTVLTSILSVVGIIIFILLMTIVFLIIFNFPK